MSRAWIAAATAFVLLCGLDFVLPQPESALAARRAAAEADALRKRVAELRPELVLLGDSMVGEGVDDAALGRRTGVSALNVQIGGAASAWCYLALKNLILPASPPRLVAVFYRDHFLTEPRFRTDGPYRAPLAALSRAEEPLLERLALDPVDPAIAILRGGLPLYQRREDLRSGVHGALIDGVGAALFDLERGAAAASFTRTFAEAALDPHRLTSRQLDAERVADELDFGRDVEGSFLPEMVRLARERGVQLVFVRVKRRRDLEPGREPNGLPRYQRELSGWLAQRGVPVVDFTHEGRLRAEHYAAGDHLSRGEDAASSPSCWRRPWCRLWRVQVGRHPAYDIQSVEPGSGGIGVHMARIAVVTGTSSGIGLATSLELAARATACSRACAISPRRVHCARRRRRKISRSR